MEILTSITSSKTPQITKKNRSNEIVGVNASENSVAVRVIFVKRRNKQTKTTTKSNFQMWMITSPSSFHALVRRILKPLSYSESSGELVN